MFAKQIKIMMKEINEKTVPQKFKEHLELNGTKQTWLAQKTGISPEHISNILADRVLLTEENKDKINKVLGTNFSN
jgi:plasmid maintenance system antidote protein VapI